MKTFSLLILTLVLSAAPARAQTAQTGKGLPTPDPSPVAPRPAPATTSVSETALPRTEASDPPESRASTPPTAEESELQSRIQTALGKDPIVGSGNVNVAVSAEGIELSGNVGSRQARVAASRIARSYAGSKKVVDKITVNPQPSDAVPEPTPEKISTAGARLHP